MGEGEGMHGASPLPSPPPLLLDLFGFRKEKNIQSITIRHPGFEKPKLLVFFRKNIAANCPIKAF